MALTIHLLGKPTVLRDGDPVAAPKGRKAWALLAYLVCSELPASREHVAELLFHEAEDPLGALRWNLAQVRRLLGQPDALRGEPLELCLPSDTFVDVDVVTHGTWLEGTRVPGLGRDLLERMHFDTSPAFEAWLMAERRHIRAATEAMLREAVLAHLGAGDPQGSARLATQLVQLNPLDEGFQALLIRTLAMAGERSAADRQYDACVELLRTELGVDPGPEVLAAHAAVEAVPVPATSSAGSTPSAARSELERGQAALAAGEVEPGLQHLRRAVDVAHRCGGVETQVEALMALGSSLISAVRSRDDEGAAALHEAISLAVRTGQRSVTAAAYRELGFVEFLRGRYRRAELFLEEALAGGGDRPAGDATALVLLGACATDTAHYRTALDRLSQAVEMAEGAQDSRPLARALAFSARVHLLRRDLAAGRDAATRSLDIARASWPAYAAWPASLLAEVDLEEGDLDRASQGFRQAFDQGCRLGDPCWEAMGARGLGLVKAVLGDSGAALEWLLDANVRAARLTDSYLWAQAYALDALCSVAVDHGAGNAARWITDLESLTARTGMRELLARAYLHRCRLGDNSARSAAVLLIGQIENPVLRDLLSSAPSPQGARPSHARSHTPGSD